MWCCWGRGLNGTRVLMSRSPALLLQARLYSCMTASGSATFEVGRVVACSLDGRETDFFGLLARTPGEKSLTLPAATGWCLSSQDLLIHIRIDAIEYWYVSCICS